MLIDEIKSILDNNEDAHSINYDLIVDIVDWLHSTLKFYYSEEKYSIYDVENIYLSLVKKVYTYDKKKKTLKIEIIYEKSTSNNLPEEESISNDVKQVKKCVSNEIYNGLIPKLKKTADKLNQLLNMPQPMQQSEQWFIDRYKVISASDGGSAMNEDHHHPVFEFIVKKLNLGPPFEDCDATHHGKKYESIADLIYEHRYDIQLLEFGLLLHPTISILGASPDSICNILKLDGKKFATIGGRMIEIKCPVSRKILTEGKIDGEQCPHGYWIQVQLQLECCDLDECDFWQCQLEEYKSRDSYLKDTDNKNPKVSAETGLERGCIIQLMPMERKILNKDFEAKFLYPPNVNMTLKEIDQWVKQALAEFDKSELAKTFIFDKICWWRLAKAGCCLIKRDKEWFKQALPKLQKTWDYVTYFRANKDAADLWYKYIETRRFKRNIEIMDVASKLMNDNGRKSYAKRLKEELDKIDISKLPKKVPKTYLPATKNIDTMMNELAIDSDDDK
jgi:putative phage-type endonuclease